MRRPFRAVEIATAPDPHPSTANQLLRTVADFAQLLFEVRGKTYAPSTRLPQFAGWMGDFARAMIGAAVRWRVTPAREVAYWTRSATTAAMEREQDVITYRYDALRNDD